jgi:WD40 repeat protein
MKVLAPCRWLARHRWLALLSLGVGLLVGLTQRRGQAPVARRLGPIPGTSPVFSHDGRFLVTHTYEATLPREDKGHLHVWDLTEDRERFAVPFDRLFPPGYSPGYSFAFSQNGEELVVAGNGRAELWDVTSGEKRGLAHEMKHRPFEQWSKLATDADGRPFWLVRTREGCYRFHDLRSGEVLGSFSVPLRRPWLGIQAEVFPGFVLVREMGEYSLWEVPSGKLRLKMPRPPTGRTYEWTLSADGRTLAFINGINGGARLWDTTTGAERALGVKADQFPSLSADGTLLAVLVHGSERPSSPLATCLGFLDEAPTGVVIYDLRTEKPVAAFPGAHSAIFAPDGRTLALLTGDGNVRLYDLSQRRGRGRAVALAVAAALAVFAIGLLVGRLRKGRVQRPS